MSALKFDVLDLIRDPDNYTSGERAQAAEAIAELIEAPRKVCSHPDRRSYDLELALTRFGGEA